MTARALVPLVVRMDARPSRAVLICLVVSLGLVAGCVDPGGTATLRTDEGGDVATHPLAPLYAGLATAPEVRFETDHGTIRLLLYTELMPTTTARFGALVTDGFYDDTLVHRVVDDFVIQGGDPSGTGQFGSGETIPFERHPELLFVAGAMGLARDVDPDSGDSQWFITERPAPHLSDEESDTAAVFGTYALYGQVFEGMDVVRAIAAVPAVPGADRPIEDVVLEDAELLPPPADLDLLHLPPTLDGPFVVGGDEVEITRPLHLFAGHAFPVTVVVTPSDDAATPPKELTLEHLPAKAGPDLPEVVRTKLAPLDDDPWVFAGEATLPAAVTWDQSVSLKGARTTPHEVAVHVLDPVLAAFAATETTDPPKDA